MGISVKRVCVVIDHLDEKPDLIYLQTIKRQTIIFFFTSVTPTTQVTSQLSKQWPIHHSIEPRKSEMSLGACTINFNYTLICKLANFS